MDESKLDPLAIEPLAAAAGLALTWHRVDHSKRNFSLRAGDRLFGGVRFEKASGSAATIDLAGARHTLKRVGVFRVRVTVRRAGEDRDLATFTPDWTGGGKLQFTGGASFTWRTRSALSSVFQWLDAGGTVVLELTPSPGGRIEAALAPGPAAAATGEYPLLAALGFYLGVIAMDELVAVTAAG